MTINDFKAGQTVVLVGNPHVKESREKEFTTVSSIGRKYLLVDACTRNKKRQFHVCRDDDEYLIEHKEFGYHVMLFPSEAAADDFIEAETLRDWLTRATAPSKLRGISLAQLRAIKTILDNGEKE